MSTTNNSPNRHIQCNVRDCRNHCTNGNYCSLDSICVGNSARSEFGAQTNCCNYRSEEDFNLRPSSDLCMGTPFFERNS